MKLFPFVVRVYGICYDQERGILVSDEFIYGQYICKFPGGGLQFGEGTIDCLKREMMEEAGQEFEVLEHFYTTDFFVPSAFDADVQVLSIYYFIRPLQPLKIKISGKGNLKLIDPPKIDFPPDFETYDPKVNANVNARKTRYYRTGHPANQVPHDSEPRRLTLEIPAPISPPCSSTRSTPWRSAPVVARTQVPSLDQRFARLLVAGPR